MNSTHPTQKILLGKIGDIPVGRSKNYRMMGRDIIIVNLGDELKGYINFCTHMGGKLRCLGEKFQCDWHGAKFDCRTGSVIDGIGGAPLGADLEKIEIQVDGDELFWMYTPKKSPWAMD